MAQHHPVQRCTVDGAVVFQSAPCLRVATGAAPAAPAGARKAEGATKRRSLADTLLDHDAADRPLPPARPLTADGDGDGAMVLPERMGAR